MFIEDIPSMILPSQVSLPLQRNNAQVIKLNIREIISFLPVKDTEYFDYNMTRPYSWWYCTYTKDAIKLCVYLF